MSAASFKGDGVYDLILTVDVTHEVSTRMVQASHDREGTLAGSSQGSAILPVLLYVYGQWSCGGSSHVAADRGSALPIYIVAILAQIPSTSTQPCPCRAWPLSRIEAKEVSAISTTDGAAILEGALTRAVL
jgi:hypothetical protein